MFTTKHLTGRVVCETDKVVYINVFIKPQYTVNNSTDSCTVQIAVSLVKPVYSSQTFSFNGPFISLSENDFMKEIEEGIDSYRQTRIFLGLD